MIVEIRTYRLRPGTRDEFLKVMQTEAVPLMAEFGLRVLACEASLVDEDGHQEGYLVRVFDSLEQRLEQEERFYGSDAWRQGPREGVLAPIESYHTIVFETDEAGAQALAGR
jgi:hypothetical protein